jgi:hypothetical protein
MRKLFIPLAKLLGIFLIIRPASYLVFDIVYLPLLMFFPGRENAWPTVLLSCAFYLVGLFMALILIFKTNKIADIVGLPNDNEELIGIDFHTILRIGMILIGVGTTIYVAPTFIGSIVGYFSLRYNAIIGYNYQVLEKIASSMLQAIFGIGLVFMSNQISQFFSQQETKKSVR